MDKADTHQLKHQRTHNQPNLQTQWPPLCVFTFAQWRPYTITCVCCWFVRRSFAGLVLSLGANQLSGEYVGHLFVRCCCSQHSRFRSGGRAQCVHFWLGQSDRSGQYALCVSDAWCSLVRYCCSVWWGIVVQCGEVLLFSVVRYYCSVWWGIVVQCGEVLLFSVVRYCCSVWWVIVVKCGEVLLLSVVRYCCSVWWGIVVQCGEVLLFSVVRYCC